MEVYNIVDGDLEEVNRSLWGSSWKLVEGGMADGSQWKSTEVDMEVRGSQ